MYIVFKYTLLYEELVKKSNQNCLSLTTQWLSGCTCMYVLFVEEKTGVHVYVFVHVFVCVCVYVCVCVCVCV